MGRHTPRAALQTTRIAGSWKAASICCEGPNADSSSDAPEPAHRRFSSLRGIWGCPSDFRAFYGAPRRVEGARVIQARTLADYIRDLRDVPTA